MKGLAVRRFALFFQFCAWVLLLNDYGWAKVYIDIHSPSARRVPIAIPQFKNMGSRSEGATLGKELAAIASADLEFSGFFEVLNPASFLEEPEKAGLTGDTITWKDWSAIGAEVLVKGGFSYDGKELKVEMRLFDVVEGRFVTGKRYYGPRQQHRLMIHKFSNEVVYRLTGEKGIFETRIALVSESSGRRDIFFMDYDGANPRRMTGHGSLVLSPDWSPDGKWLAFTSYRDGPPGLFLRALASGKETKLPFKEGLSVGPAWSPDGERIALTLSLADGNSEIFVVDRRGNKVERVTKNWANDVSPSWSADETKIAFVSNRAGSPQIYTIDVGTKRVTRLTYEGSYNASPSWSPRGDLIAFTRVSGNESDIYVIRPDGTGLRRLTARSGKNEDPTWAPNGRHIAFTSTRDGVSRIYAMPVDGSQQRPLSSGGRYAAHPSWSPHLKDR